jgi:hypothetical protein
MYVEHEPVDVGAVQRGDVILVEGNPGDPLNKLIMDLDGSAFSHVGIAMGDGTMLSCRLSYDTETWSRSDRGGVRRDDLVTLMGKRKLHLARTRDSSGRLEAAARMEQWEEHEGDRRTTSFSFVKLFVVAVALRAVRKPEGPARDELYDRADDAARSWRHDLLDPPSFYCAEAVAAAFGATFRRDDLVPPPDAQAALLGDGWLDGIEALADLAVLEGGSVGRVVDLIQLLRTVDEHDPDFLRESAQLLIKLLLARRRATEEPEVEKVPDDSLPTALVTPRMLRDASWVEWVAPIVPG